MQFKVAAALALASTVAAGYNATTTEVVTSFTTYCPEATTLTYGGSTYTVTEATTLTITNCPCTITKPVYTSSSVAAPTTAPVYSNGTTTAVPPPVVPTTTAVGTISATVKPSTSASVVPASGAGKTFAASGASLAGLLGLVAYLL